MQAVRRSDRIRNRLGNIGDIDLLPDLNMGGNGNNVQLDETGNLEAEVAPNMADFVPNEQGDHLLNNGQIPTRGITTRLLEPNCLKVLLLIFSLIAIIPLTEILTPIILDRLALKESSIKEKNFELVNYYSLKRSTDRLIRMNKKIKYLNKKLTYLNKALDETIKWSDSIKTETGKIKNETLHEVSLKLEEAINLYDADKVGMIDHALESAGGYITSIPNTTPFPSRISYDLMGIVNFQYPSNPRLLIQPGTLPGECFAFKGNNGRIRIRLTQMVDITAVTIEHASPNLVDDMSSAPKDFSVYGLLQADSVMRVELGTFSYSLDEKPLQTFHVPRQSENNYYEHVELHILTNQGNSEYTCVYRFRVHGNTSKFKDNF